MDARRLLFLVERTCIVIGVIGLAGWGVFHIRSVAAAQQSLEQFATLKAIALPAGTPDQSLWSPGRVSAWQKALSAPVPVPLAVLRIPKIHLEAPVWPGTDDGTLDRAVGHIDGTATPGTEGNSGLAGHRDGFFRGLKDIGPGDVIELETIEGHDRYRVERVWIVDPEDVSVLDPTSTRALTLVTCYPFYFVGSAPRRFIVRAVLASDSVASSSPSAAHAPCLLCGDRRRVAVFGFSHVS
jgi:sortase A